MHPSSIYLIVVVMLDHNGVAEVTIAELPVNCTCFTGVHK